MFTSTCCTQHTVAQAKRTLRFTRMYILPSRCCRNYGLCPGECTFQPKNRLLFAISAEQSSNRATRSSVLEGKNARESRFASVGRQRSPCRTNIAILQYCNSACLTKRHFCVVRCPLSPFWPLLPRLKCAMPLVVVPAVFETMLVYYVLNAVKRSRGSLQVSWVKLN